MKITGFVGLLYVCSSICVQNLMRIEAQEDCFCVALNYFWFGVKKKNQLDRFKMQKSGIGEFLVHVNNTLVYACIFLAARD